MLRRLVISRRQHLPLIGLSAAVRSTHFRICTLSLRCIRWAATTAAQQKLQSQQPTSPGNKMLVEIAKDLSSVEQEHSAFLQPHPDILPDILTTVKELVARSASFVHLLRAVRRSPTLLQFFVTRDSIRQLAETLACTAPPFWAARVLRVATKLGCRHKQNAYECVAYRLAGLKHWKAVLAVVALGKRETGRCTSRLLNWRIRALVETQRYASLQNVLAEFKEYNILPTRRTFHLILSGHIRNRNLADAKRCIRLMTEAGFSLDATTRAIMAMEYRALGPDPEVHRQSMDALKDVQESFAVMVLNGLIQACLDAQNIPSVLDYLSLFHHGHVDTIITALTVHRPNANLAPSVFSGTSSNLLPVIEQKLTPTSATYAIIIDYLSSHSTLEDVYSAIQRMLSLGLQPTSGIISSLIKVYFSSGNGDLAVRMVAAMCDSRRAPFKMFRRLLMSRSRARIPWLPSLMPDTRIFNSLLRGILHSHGMNGGQTILNIMHAQDVKPNSTTVAIILSYLSSVEDIDVTALMRSLRKFISPAIRPTLQHVHIILLRALRHEKYLLHGRGWNALSAYVSKKHQYDRRSLGNNDVLAVRESFDPTAGLDVQRLSSFPVQSLLDRDARSDRSVVGTRIKHQAYTNPDFENAREIFRTLLVRGLHPSEYHFSALMEVLALAGDMEGAFDVLKSAVRVGIKPNAVMYTILIAGYARLGSPDAAMRMFQQMISVGVRPDVPAIDAVVSAFFAVGAYPTARKLLISLWSFVQPFPYRLRWESLRVLARSFRALHKGQQNQVIAPSKRQRQIVRWKLNRLLKRWKCTEKLA